MPINMSGIRRIKEKPRNSSQNTPTTQTKAAALWMNNSVSLYVNGHVSAVRKNAIPKRAANCLGEGKDNHLFFPLITRKMQPVIMVIRLPHQEAAEGSRYGVYTEKLMHRGNNIPTANIPIINLDTMFLREDV